MIYLIDCIESKHKGGTKSYRIWTVHRSSEDSSSDRALVITQWGANGALDPTSAFGGESKVDTFDSFLEANIYAERKRVEKQKRGYDRWRKIVTIDEKSHSAFLKHVRQTFVPSDYARIVAHFDGVRDDKDDNVDHTMEEAHREEPFDNAPGAEEWGSW